MLYRLSYQIIFSMNDPKFGNAKIMSFLKNMQKLSAIFILMCIVTVLFSGQSLAQTSATDATSALESGNKAFEAGQFTLAIKNYQIVVEQGKFSEIMLYRLAFMHENLREYPEAIFFLKKAAQEFGEKDTPSKIRQLMQKQGSTKFFSNDPWNGYLTFFRSWGWIIYLVFALSIVALAAHLLTRNPNKPIWRQLAMVSAWTLLIASGMLLIHRSFLIPDRAVLMETTAFYSAPGFSANHHLNGFSLGETLDIDDHSDIWIQVSAGGKQWWVPNWVVREL